MITTHNQHMAAVDKLQSLEQVLEVPPDYTKSVPSLDEYKIVMLASRAQVQELIDEIREEIATYANNTDRIYKDE